MANKDFFAVVYPMTNKSGAGDSLRQFINKYGRSEKLFIQNVRKYSISYHVTEPYRPNHNFAEGAICKMRKKWYLITVQKSVPQRLWDYGLQLTCDMRHTESHVQQHARTGQ